MKKVNFLNISDFLGNIPKFGCLVELIKPHFKTTDMKNLEDTTLPLFQEQNALKSAFNKRRILYFIYSIHSVLLKNNNNNTNIKIIKLNTRISLKELWRKV